MVLTSNIEADIFSKEKRSKVMALVKSKHTKPEIMLRSALHKKGYRFRLHRKDLPGKPDIVIPKYNTVIMVNGCFWHQHTGCRKATIPKQNQKFWADKLERNVCRDIEIKTQLEKLGWKVIVVWECELKKHKEILLGNIDKILKDK